jgi:dTDP-4-dehydrorhamnose reductase
VKRLLVTGGSGDLGSVLSERAVAAGWSVTATYLAHPEKIRAGHALYCNLTEPESVRRVIDEAQPDAIIHTAITETTPNYETAIGIAADLLWRHAPSTARLILLSSDMVFDGSAAPYAEDAPTNPLSAYGRAKARMERSAPGLIVRTSLIYDFDLRNRQVNWMLSKLRKGERIHLFTDEYRSPIWAVDLADALLTLAEQDVTGILNVAGPSRMSRYDLGHGLLSAFGYDADAYIVPGSQVGTGRPADLTLNVTCARQTLNRNLLTFGEAHDIWKQRDHKPPRA